MKSRIQIPNDGNSIRIFGKECSHAENSKLNNNVLIIGTSGCGKTGSYVTPNLYCTGGSIVVADTKGLLHRRHRKALESRGYKVILFDFVNPGCSVPYNILNAIRCTGQRELCGFTKVLYKEQDISKITFLLIPDCVDAKEVFWLEAARTVLASLIAYVIEVLEPEAQHMGSVNALFRKMCGELNSDNNMVSFFEDLRKNDPDSYAVKKYDLFRFTVIAEKCWISIQQFVSNALDLFDSSDIAKMLCRPGIDISACGREKTAMFVNISDTDRSMDHVINIFYSQLFNLLCMQADAKESGSLDVPVHIILDDFASNVFIPDFDKIISVIRSRKISASIILQSLSQLDGMYSHGKASTIINNCDTMLYLGGQDVDTARFFGEKASRLPATILSLDDDHAWIFTRGEEARIIEKIPPYSMDAKDFYKVP